MIMLLSINRPITDLFSFKTSWWRSIISVSLIPLSTTLASSITSSVGGPGSTFGSAKGRISAVQMRIPLSPRSGNGLSGCIFTPVITSVFASFTLAEPFAFGITPVSMDNCLCSSKVLPSTLLPSLSKSKILSRFN